MDLDWKIQEYRKLDEEIEKAKKERDEILKKIGEYKYETESFFIRYNEAKGKCEELENKVERLREIESGYSWKSKEYLSLEDAAKDANNKLQSMNIDIATLDKLISEKRLEAIFRENECKNAEAKKNGIEEEVMKAMDILRQITQQIEQMDLVGLRKQYELLKQDFEEEDVKYRKLAKTNEDLERSIKSNEYKSKQSFEVAQKEIGEAQREVAELQEESKRIVEHAKVLDERERVLKRREQGIERQESKIEKVKYRLKEYAKSINLSPKIIR